MYEFQSDRLIGWFPKLLPGAEGEMTTRQSLDKGCKPYTGNRRWLIETERRQYQFTKSDCSFFEQHLNVTSVH